MNTAKMLGNLNEIFSYSDGSADDTKNDRKIDLYNNHIGRTQAQHYKNNITPEQAIERAMYMINYTNQPALNGNDKRVLEYKNK